MMEDGVKNSIEFIIQKLESFEDENMTEMKETSDIKLTHFDFNKQQNDIQSINALTSQENSPKSTIIYSQGNAAETIVVTISSTDKNSLVVTDRIPRTPPLHRHCDKENDEFYQVSMEDDDTNIERDNYQEEHADSQTPVVQVSSTDARPSPIRRINDEFYETANDENSHLEIEPAWDESGNSLQEEAYVKERQEEEAEARKVADHVAALMNERKLVVEKESMERARVTAHKWRMEGASLSEAIDESLREYGDILERAHALRLMFEWEREGWSNWMAREVQNEVKLTIEKYGFDPNNRFVDENAFNENSKSGKNKNGNSKTSSIKSDSVCGSPGARSSEGGNIRTPYKIRKPVDMFTNSPQRNQARTHSIPGKSSEALAHEEESVSDVRGVSLPFPMASIVTPVTKPFQAPAKRPACAPVTVSKKRKLDEECDETE